MSRPKLGLLGLCVTALSLMAFTAGSASAAEWLILTKGGESKTATELNASIEGELEKSDGSLLMHLVSLYVKVLCKNPLFGFASNVRLESEGKLNSGGLAHFHDCETSTLSLNSKKEYIEEILFGCEVSSVGMGFGEIQSNGLKGQLQANGEVLIQSNTTVLEGLELVGVLAELKFEGSECPFEGLGTIQLKGVLWLKDCEAKAATHLVKHLIEESTAHGSTLWVGKDTKEHLETKLDGSALVFFKGTHTGLAWGAMFP